MNPILGDIYFANLHSHTVRCQHARGTEEDFILRAIESGMDCLGFADHTPWPYKSDFVADMRMHIRELDSYLSTLRRLREKYADRIRIMIGLECEAFPEFYGWMEEIREKEQLDYFLLGNHYDTSDENSSGRYFGRVSSPHGLERYTLTTIAGMESGHFLYLCHPDLPLFRYPVFDRAAKEMCRQICLAAKGLDMPLEYNMLGMKRNGEARSRGYIGYCSDEFWQIAAKTGNKAIIGVDAHAPEDLDCVEQYRQARAYLSSLGIEVLEMMDILK